MEAIALSLGIRRYKVGYSEPKGEAGSLTLFFKHIFTSF